MKELFKCVCCTDKYEQLPDLYQHIEEEHEDIIPKDFTAAQFYYAEKTGKMHGTCVMCKGKTKWNETTSKYHRFCDNPKCKEEYRQIFVKRMIGVHGKATLLDDPNQQKKMLANRSISGTYTWRDGKEFTYTGSYEADFLRFLDLFMQFESSDIMAPSPHTYYYKYDGKKRFYIPDFFIPSLNLEIEIKDGKNNSNNHPKIQAVDKVKEKLKDEVLLSQKNFSYIKVVNKEYDNFFDVLMQMKKDIAETGKPRLIFDLGNDKGIIVKGPVMESLYAEDYEMDEGTFREIIRGVESPSVLSSILESTNMTPEFKREMELFQAFQNTNLNQWLESIDQYDSDHDSVERFYKSSDLLKTQGLIGNVRTPGFTSPHIDNLFVNIIEQVTYGWDYEAIKSICDTFKESLYSVGTKETIERYTRDAALMQYYFKLLASKLDKERLDICHIGAYIDQIVTEAALQIEGEDGYPVYVLLTHTGTTLSNTIKRVTEQPYSHASISFDPELRNMYSFGRKYKNNPLIGSFVREDIQQGLFKDVQDNATYSLYVTFVTKEQLEAMQTRLSYFKENGSGFTYSFKGLINFRLGRETDSVDSFFCSQFVDHILTAGRQYFDRHSSLVAPTDFSLHKDFYFVSKGKLKNYNPDLAEKRTVEISRNAKFQSKIHKETVVYLGLTAKQAKERVVDSFKETKGDVVYLASDLPTLKKMIQFGKLGENITHYSVLLLDDVKRKNHVFLNNGEYMLQTPVKIKITNVNVLS